MLTTILIIILILILLGAFPAWPHRGGRADPGDSSYLALARKNLGRRASRILVVSAKAGLQ
jgi:hypothetical protein